MMVKIMCREKILRVQTGGRRAEGLSSAEIRERENSAEEQGSQEENPDNVTS